MGNLSYHFDHRTCAIAHPNPLANQVCYVDSGKFMGRGDDLAAVPRFRVFRGYLPTGRYSCDLIYCESLS